MEGILRELEGQKAVATQMRSLAIELIRRQGGRVTVTDAQMLEARGKGVLVTAQPAFHQTIYAVLHGE